MQIAVVDVRARGAHRDISDLEECRMDDGTAMTCPGGIVFERVRGDPARWRVRIEFSRPGRSPEGGYRGPLGVRFSYDVEGEKRVHGGTIDRCTSAGSGMKVVCSTRGPP